MPSITHFTERLKVHKIQGFLKINWDQLKYCLQPIKGLDVGSIKASNFSPEIFYKIAGKDKTQWSKLTLHDHDGDFTAEHLNKIIINSQDDQISQSKIKTAEWVGTSLKYTEIYSRFQRLFDYAFDWDTNLYKWYLVKVCSPIANDNKMVWSLDQILKPDLLPGFSGSVWAFYKYTDGGVERMVLQIDPRPDTSGVHGVKVLGKERAGTTENVVFRGQIFLDEKYNTVLLLKDDLNRYAHLMLLTPELSPTDKREICIGHLSYFSRNPEVERYLTKTIVLVNCTLNPMPAKHLSFEERSTDNEKMILSFLSNRRQNRLTTPGADIFAWKGFRIWFDKQRSSGRSQSGESKVIASYMGKYHVYYMKKHPKSSPSLDNIFEFFHDELNLTTIEDSKGLHAVYKHFQSLTKEALSAGRNQIHTDYEGELRIWGSYLSGQLFSEQGGPLYITAHIRDRGFTPIIERFVGALVGERDSGVVTVAYTCVIVPDLIVKGFEEAKTYKNKLKIIEDFLENEAKKGWGVIDPPRRNVNSFMIDDLRSEDN